jgi:serine/threonine-protein kinase RsbW
MTHSNNGGDADASPQGDHRMALEFQIPSDVRHIEGVVAAVQKRCEELSFPRRHCSLNIPVALTEALSNAILRGNKEDPAKSVRVRVEASPEHIVLEIKDEGTGFDLQRSMRDPTRPENLSREDGRGLFLMSRLMDRVESFSARGNVVRMTLRRDE